MGCEIQAAISATRIRGLDGLPADNVFVGDLEDLETAAAGADLLVANSNGRQAAGKARRSGPTCGPDCRCSIVSAPTRRCGSATGGRMNLLFEMANMFQANAKEAQKLAHN